MIMRFLSLLFLGTITCHAFSRAVVRISSIRNPRIPYEYYLEKAIQEVKYSPDFDATVLSVARYYTGENLPDATSWDSLQELNDQFKNVRNERFITWTGRREFPRRITWLYPLDGCYARAAAANLWFKNNKINVPKTIFAIGNLMVKTKNSPRGAVWWWFHVAPVVQVEDEKYVIDPSIEPKKALTVKEWLERMGTPSKIRVAICGAGTYSPKSSCALENVPTWGPYETANFFAREWNQLERLGKSPELYLGPNPPWESLR